MTQDIIFTPKIDDKNALKQASDLSDQLAKGVMKGNAQFKVMEKLVGIVGDYLSDMLSKNKEVVAESAKLRAAFATAIQPLYEDAVPVLKTILKIITSIVTVIGKITSSLFGKDYTQSEKNAKALNSEAKAIKGVGGAAKEAQKSLAGFDEINKLNSPDSSGGGGGGAGGAASGPLFDFGMDAEIDKLTVKIEKLLPAVLAIAAGFKLWQFSKFLPEGLSDITKKFAGLLFIIGGAVLLWDGFKDAVENGMNLTNLSEMVGGILAIGFGISLLTGTWLPLLVSVFFSALLALAYFTGHGDQLIHGLTETFGGLYDAAVAFGKEDWDGVVDGLKRSFSGVKEVIESICLSIWDAEVAVGKLILKMLHLDQSAQNIIDERKSTTEAIAEYLKTALESGVYDPEEFSKYLSDQIVSGKWHFTDVRNAINEIFSGMEVDGVRVDMEQIGIDSSGGLIDGIIGMTGEVEDAVDDTVKDAIIDRAKQILDIHSPSVVMKEIGEYAVEGLTDGLDTFTDKSKTWLSDFKLFLNETVEASRAAAISLSEIFGGISFPEFDHLGAGLPAVAAGSVVPPWAQNYSNGRETITRDEIEAIVRNAQMEETRGNDRVIDLLTQLINAVGSIQIGDDVIGKAADRYSRTTARAYGR